MPRPRSLKAAESEEKVLKALAGLRSGQYDNPSKAARETGASKATQFDRININGQEGYYITSITWGFRSRTHVTLLRGFSASLYVPIYNSTR